MLAIQIVRGANVGAGAACVVRVGAGAVVGVARVAAVGVDEATTVGAAWAAEAREAWRVEDGAEQPISARRRQDSTRVRRITEAAGVYSSISASQGHVATAQLDRKLFVETPLMVSSVQS